MSVKPNKTVRIFTVEQKWQIPVIDLEKIICDHLGIPYDGNNEFDINNWGDTTVIRTTSDRQEE